LRIAINTRLLLPKKMEGIGWYTFEIVRRMVKEHPEHEFFFFFDRPYDPRFVFEDNVTPIVLSPPARHPILFVFWFEIAIRKALKKHQIDLFFSTDGYLCLGTKVPQVGVIHDINYEHFPKDVPWTVRTYLKYFFPKFARKAAHIITVSEFSKSDIGAIYDIKPDRITAIWNDASEGFIPIGKEEKTEIRLRYTGGKPYFLFVGSIHPRKNVGRLLEAFLLFKKQSATDYKLVIVGEPMWKKKAFMPALPDSLKEQIIFTGHLRSRELCKIMGAAEVFTFVSYFEGFGIPLVEAMRCGIPILCADRTALPEVAGEVALYCNPFDIEDIAEKMMRIAEDQTLRDQLAQKGMERSSLFSWDKSAKKVWEVLMGVMNSK
jgi:glycosyltransferase involved in cell wall biosynthesis